MNEEVHDQRLVLAEGIDECGGRVRQQQHVGFVDRLETTDRTAVEHQAVGEDGFCEVLHGEREVLHDARQVTEADVDELDVVLPDVVEYLVGAVEHPRATFPGGFLRMTFGPGRAATVANSGSGISR
jgi:hypothetical protein